MSFNLKDVALAAGEAGGKFVELLAGRGGENRLTGVKGDFKFGGLAILIQTADGCS